MVSIQEVGSNLVKFLHRLNTDAFRIFCKFEISYSVQITRCAAEIFGHVSDLLQPQYVRPGQGLPRHEVRR